MNHRPINTEHAPAAIGPYSQGMTLDIGDRKLLFLAGQIPLDPGTGELVLDSVEAQVERVMENIGAVLREAGSGFDRMVKVTIYLQDMNDFAVVNEVYARYVSDPAPARATVAVRGLPKDVSVEIEAIAYA
jgi:2-iminobutanoate/2-iminopropanoate deaminase